jgi:stage V sporulation protein G
VVITEVRIKLMEDHNENERLQAFCSVTFDNAYVVRDLKIIEGAKGPFVAMPSRKLTDRCMHCGCKNHLRARFCNQCGHKLNEDRAGRDAEGRAKLHADIAHPINSACRELIQNAVVKAYQEERELSKQPGYVPSYDDYDTDEEVNYSQVVSELHSPARSGTIDYRAHSAHAPRGTHNGVRHGSPQEAARVTAGRGEERADDFGAGIL